MTDIDPQMDIEFLTAAAHVTVRVPLAGNQGVAWVLSGACPGYGGARTGSGASRPGMDRRKCAGQQ